MAATRAVVFSPAKHALTASLDRSLGNRHRVPQRMQFGSHCANSSLRGSRLALAGGVWKSQHCRTRLHIVGTACPSVDEVAVTTEPLTKADLVAYLASGCKPKEKWRIGTEHEKLGFQLDTLEPLTYEQIARLLEGMANRFGWERLMDGANIIGLKAPDGQNVSLESGGQLELSGVPLETLHQTREEINLHLHQVNVVGEELGLGFAAIGFQPKWRTTDVPVTPKERSRIMWNYMPKVGIYGQDVMASTCTVQVNLDFESEEDMVRKLRVGLALQPIATAIFANSPFREGKPNGYLSYRSHMYMNFDKDRTGHLPFVFEDGFGFERYVDYALDVPMYFVYRNKQYVDCSGLSFRDFMAGRLSVLPGEWPTLSDWEDHLSAIFTEVRVRRYLEMRGADIGPCLYALPAFWVGLLYDKESLQGALDIISDWTAKERAMLRSQVPKHGLEVPFQGGLLKHVAQDIFKLAKDGLSRRGCREVGFLNEIEETVRTGVTSAERLLNLYHEKWGENIDPIFEELKF